ncbi:MAG: hypothetical protein AB7F43_03725 [Bacteriovoracia bacterium]
MRSEKSQQIQKLFQFHIALLALLGLGFFAIYIPLITPKTRYLSSSGGVGFDVLYDALISDPPKLSGISELIQKEATVKNLFPEALKNAGFFKDRLVRGKIAAAFMALEARRDSIRYAAKKIQDDFDINDAVFFEISQKLKELSNQKRVQQGKLSEYEELQIKTKALQKMNNIYGNQWDRKDKDYMSYHNKLYQNYRQQLLEEKQREQTHPIQPVSIVIGDLWEKYQAFLFDVWRKVFRFLIKENLKIELIPLEESLRLDPKSKLSLTTLEEVEAVQFVLATEAQKNRLEQIERDPINGQQIGSCPLVRIGQNTYYVHPSGVPYLNKMFLTSSDINKEENISKPKYIDDLRYQSKLLFVTRMVDLLGFEYGLPIEDLGFPEAIEAFTNSDALELVQSEMPSFNSKEQMLIAFLVKQVNRKINHRALLSDPLFDATKKMIASPGFEEFGPVGDVDHPVFLVRLLYWHRMAEDSFSWIKAEEKVMKHRGGGINLEYLPDFNGYSWKFTEKPYAHRVKNGFHPASISNGDELLTQTELENGKQTIIFSVRNFDKSAIFDFPDISNLDQNEDLGEIDLLETSEPTSTIETAIPSFSMKGLLPIPMVLGGKVVDIELFKDGKKLRFKKDYQLLVEKKTGLPILHVKAKMSTAYQFRVRFVPGEFENDSILKESVNLKKVRKLASKAKNSGFKKLHDVLLEKSKNPTSYIEFSRIIDQAGTYSTDSSFGIRGRGKLKRYVGLQDQKGQLHAQCHQSNLLGLDLSEDVKDDAHNLNFQYRNCFLYEGNGLLTVADLHAHLFVNREEKVVGNIDFTPSRKDTESRKNKRKEIIKLMREKVQVDPLKEIKNLNEALLNSSYFKGKRYKLSGDITRPAQAALLLSSYYVWVRENPTEEVKYLNLLSENFEQAGDFYATTQKAARLILKGFKIKNNLASYSSDVSLILERILFLLSSEYIDPCRLLLKARGVSLE